MKLTTLFILIFLSISINSCNPFDNDDCGNAGLQFNLPLQAYGIKDTLYLGDTIRIQLDIPDRMPERRSGILYDFIDYNFKLITYMVKIDSLPINGNSASTFDWIILEGESKYVGGVYLVLPDYYDHVYHYEVLIIAKQKGLFNFGMNSDGGGYTPLKKLDGPCS